MKGKTFYLCDRRRCQNCQYPTCKHTESIFNAKNFHAESGNFYEDDDKDIYLKAYWDVIFLIKDIKDKHKDDEKINIIDELENEIKKGMKKYLHK